MIKAVKLHNKTVQNDGRTEGENNSEMAGEVRFELTTFGFGDRRSTVKSYSPVARSILHDF